MQGWLVGCSHDKGRFFQFDSASQGRFQFLDLRGQHAKVECLQALASWLQLEVPPIKNGMLLYACIGLGGSLQLCFWNGLYK
jgi:hypothetical protein